MSNYLTARAGDPAIAISASGQVSVTGDLVGEAYSLPVFIHQTTNTADNTCVWAMLNTSATRTVRIANLDLSVLFAGVAATGDTAAAGYSLHKFTVAVPAGGTALAVSPHATANATSGITNARFAAGGVTMTSAVYSGPLAQIMLPLTAASAISPFSLARGGHEIVLAQDEGFAILLEGAAVAGLQIVGGISWIETV